MTHGLGGDLNPESDHYRVKPDEVQGVMIAIARLEAKVDIAIAQQGARVEALDRRVASMESQNEDNSLRIRALEAHDFSSFTRGQVLTLITVAAAAVAIFVSAAVAILTR